MNKRTIPVKEQLIELYSNGLSMKEIGKELNMATGKVYKWFHIYKIETREWGSKSIIARSKISKSKTGVSVGKGRKFSKEHIDKLSRTHTVGIGRKEKNQKGYVRIYFPSHPKADKRGWILEHDLIMECNLGRWLDNNEVVHHINGIKDDNRLKNLQLMTRSEHAKLHRLERLNRNGVMTY